MKILFIGGTGVISSSCTELCIENGFDLHLLTRGKSRINIPKEVHHIKTDINDIDECRSLFKDHFFDCIVSWISFSVDDIKRDLKIFGDKTSQYIFISSASGYAKPPKLNLDETHKFWNPIWTYSQNKVFCEQYLNTIREEVNFSITIVRPSHTYNNTKIPLQGHYTTLNRLLTGKEVIIHGDGNTIWTLTHSSDFAKGFITLLGNPRAYNDVYHITSDEHLTWNQICITMAEAAGVEAKIVHVPSDYIMKKNKLWGEGLLGDKAHNMVFDNSKIKSIAPEFNCDIRFIKGAKEIIDWYKKNSKYQKVNLELDKLMDDIVNKFRYS